jgi:MFS family permease
LLNLRSYFRFPPTVSPELRRNIIAYFWDIGWWGLYMGSTVAFLSIYATRYGATPEQIGLLTALPALLSLVLSLPMGWLLQRFPAGRATVLSAFVSRLLFLVYALLPWLMPDEMQVEALIVLGLVITVPQTMINISFSQFFMEAIPGEWRGAVVGTRNAIMSLISFPVTLLCGQLLTWLEFPTGYQVVFFIGFIGGIMTAGALNRVRPLEHLAAPAVNPLLAEKRKWLPTVTSQARVYIRVVMLLFLFNLTNNMVAPLVPDLLVRQLGLSEGMIGIGTAMANLLVFLVSLRIAVITRRTGNRRGTAFGAFLLTGHAVLLALAQDAVLYLAAAILGGIAAGVLGAAQYNFHLDNLPETERSSWLSWNLLLGNAAILLGALAGPAVAHIGGTPLALLIIGGLRLAIGLAILVWGEKKALNTPRL